MQKLIYRNPNGEEIDFTSGDFGVTKWEGFSHVDMDVQSQQVPFNDGSVFLDALLGERDLSITVAINDGGDLEKRYRLKRELIHCLNPKLGEGELIYTNDYTSKKIVCVPAIPEFGTKNINDSGTLKSQISFTASNPYWEDLENKKIYFDAWTEKTLNNAGDVPCEIEADIIGIGAKNPKIRNVTTGKKIEYEGVLENSLKIKTYFGNKIVETEKLDYNLLVGGQFNSIVSTDKLNVVVGNAVMISENTEKWEMQYTGLDKILYSVCYSKHLKNFIAVGEDGSIISSPDGKNWEIQTAGINDKLNAICYSENLNLFVAVGINGTILTSPDGTTWTSISSGVSVELNEIIYSEHENIFIIVGANGTILTSPDGTTWTLRTSNSTEYLVSICYSEEKEYYLAISASTQILKSEDGITWVDYSEITTAGTMTNIIYNNKLKSFIVVVMFTTTSGIYTSPDGITWTVKSELGDLLNQIVYCDNSDLFCVIGNNGMISISQNLVDWGIKRNNLNVTINAICYSENLNMYVAVGNSGTILTSLDGIVWTKIQNVYEYSNYYDVIYAKNKFIVIGGAGTVTVVTSDDGINWQNIPYTLSQKDLYSICYSEKLDLFVIVGTKNDYNQQLVLATSPDGITWTSRNAPSSIKSLKKVIYIKSLEKFYAVGQHNGIVESSDGITWALVSFSSFLGQNEFVGICYSEELK